MVIHHCCFAFGPLPLPPFADVPYRAIEKWSPERVGERVVSCDVLNQWFQFLAAVQDDRERAQSPGANVETRPEVDDSDATHDIEHSFRLIFPNEVEISFFADTDEEKARWYVFYVIICFLP